MDMHKTKLGISVGLLGALVYFATLFSGGYTIPVLLCGYVLLVEDNPWLRKASVKALVILVTFSLASFLVGLIPRTVGAALSFTNVSISFLYTVQNVIDTLLGLVSDILLLILGVKAFTQGTLKLPVIDKLIEKYMD